MYTKPTRQELIIFIENSRIKIPNINYMKRNQIKDYILDLQLEWELTEFIHSFRFIYSQGIK